MVNEKGESVFGDGLAELLEEIDKTHSMLEAAKNLKMSYRYALAQDYACREAPWVSCWLRGVVEELKAVDSQKSRPSGKNWLLRYRKAQAELDRVLKKLP